MTDITKSLLLGTDATGSSYHDLMRSVTVHSMRNAAGYVAKNAPETECSLPEFIFVQANVVSAYNEYTGEVEHENGYIIVDSSLCWHCRTSLNNTYQTIYFRWDYAAEKDNCQICNAKLRHDNDDIPF